jgi:hypothetical protein
MTACVRVLVEPTATLVFSSVSVCGLGLQLDYLTEALVSALIVFSLSFWVTELTLDFPQYESFFS